MEFNLTYGFVPDLKLKELVATNISAMYEVCALRFYNYKVIR